MFIDEPANVARRIIIGSLIICMFVYGIVNEKKISAELKKLVRWCRTLGLWAPVFITIVSTICPVIMLPVFPLMALSGPLFTEMYSKNALLGGAVAFAAVFTGLWLGSVIAFALGKYLFREWAEKAARSSDFLKRINRIIATGGTKIVFMARSLPILPAEVFDYACALTDLDVWQYAIGCFGSAVPVAFWTFSSAQADAVAHHASSDSPAHHVGFIIINVIALVLLTLVLGYTIKQLEPPEGREVGVANTREPSIVGASPDGSDDEDSPLQNHSLSEDRAGPSPFRWGSMVRGTRLGSFS